MNFKKITLSLVAAICLCCTGLFGKAHAIDLEGTYIAPKVAYSFMAIEDIHQAGSAAKSNSHEQAWGGALAVGYDFGVKTQIPMRAELEYSLFETQRYDSSNEVAGRLERSQAVLANIYYDVKTGTMFTPYAGIGAGVGFVGGDTNFAWNLRTGIAVDITDSIKADLGYRYVQMGEVEGYRTYKGDLYAHDLMLGVRYTF